MRTFTIEQVRGWVNWWTTNDTVDCEAVTDRFNGLAAWCDRQAKAAPTLPPRPSDEWVAAQRWDGKRVELTGDCLAPNVGDLFLSEDGNIYERTLEPCSLTEPRWILRTIEPAATPQAKTCATCWHWFTCTKTCRKNSPGFDAHGIAMWPRTASTDACGKWKAAAR